MTQLSLRSSDANSSFIELASASDGFGTTSVFRIGRTGYQNIGATTTAPLCPYSSTDNGVTVGLQAGVQICSQRFIAGSTGTVAFVGGDSTATQLLLSLNSIPTLSLRTSAVSSSAVNYIDILSLSGSAPILLSTGTDADVPLTFNTKGIGPMSFYTGSNLVLNLPFTASAVNYVQLTASPTGAAVQLISLGSDSNVPIVVRSQGPASTITLAPNNVAGLSCGPSGVQMTGYTRATGYGCVGCISAPTNTIAGAFSTTKATPVLQAFGAVTANAASGLLSFTVSTAAVTCATAVVTNTNVVAGSEVILTMQSYTGTKFTNGFPSVARADTSGSSVGSFTIELCNSHATNALNGNLFIAFWILN